MLKGQHLKISKSSSKIYMSYSLNLIKLTELRCLINYFLDFPDLPFAKAKTLQKAI